MGNCRAPELAAFGFDELFQNTHNSVELIIAVYFGLLTKHSLESYQLAIALIGLRLLSLVFAPF